MVFEGSQMSRRGSRVAAVLLAAVATVVAVGADAQSYTAAPVAAGPVVDEPRAQVIALPAGAPAVRTIVENDANPPAAEVLAAARLRVVPNPQVLPVGRAPERGLQVRTVLASRIISALFPEIQNIGGVRPDALRWHPDGLALDVMIPNPSSAAGIALGDRIVAFVLRSADRIGIQDAIWRDTYYTPNGPSGSGYGHYDHVHVTTTGGGYPDGSQVYYR